MTTTELLDRLRFVDARMDEDGIEPGHPLRQAQQEAIRRTSPDASRKLIGSLNELLAKLPAAGLLGFAAVLDDAIGRLESES